MKTTHDERAEDSRARSSADQYDALRQVATAVVRGASSSSIFALVAERAARLVGADGCGIVRFDADGRGRLVGRWAQPAVTIAEVPKDIPLDGGSAVAKVFRTGRPARADSYRAMSDSRGRVLAQMYRVGIAVPVHLGLGVWGAVAVGSMTDDAITETTQEQLADFAELVALAVASPDPTAHAGIEMLLDTLLWTAPVGFAFLDRDLRFVRVNKTLAGFTGRHPDEHVGRTPSEVFSRFPSTQTDALRQVRDTGVPISDQELRFRVPTEHDPARTFLSSLYPVHSERGEIIGVGVVVVDVTDLKDTQDDLRRERDYSAALIEAMQDGLAVASLDGTLIDVNIRFCEMTGFSVDELVGASPPYPYWPLDQRPQIEAAFQRALAGDTGVQDQIICHRDGHRLRVVVAHAPMRDERGEVRGLVATVSDVTERRRADEERVALLEAERIARARTELLQAMTAALSTALTPGQVLDVAVRHGLAAIVAPRALAFIVEDEMLVPVHAADVSVDAIGNPKHMSLDDPSPLAAALRTGTALFFESRQEIRRFHPAALDRLLRDTTALAVIPVLIDSRAAGLLCFGYPEPRRFSAVERALLATVGDLCAQALERARLYERTRESAEMLRERDALKTAVLRGVSHEFRSPLTAIANAAGALEHIDDAAERADLVGVVADETRRLDRLVANVLDLSRLEGGVLEPRLDWCSAAELVAGVLDSATSLTDTALVEVEIPDDLPLMRADPVLTERILLNLVQNAARHGRPPIRFEVRRASETIDFAVSDNGPGVPADARESIFEPFVGQRDRGGLGLGLGLSRGLAEAQGGLLRLDPTDSGARFVLSLPVDEWGRQ